MEILTLADLLELEWSEVIDGAPDPVLECYRLEDALAAARFVEIQGPAFLRLCRLYVHYDCGRAVVSIEPLASAEVLIQHVARLLAVGDAA